MSVKIYRLKNKVANYYLSTYFFISPSYFSLQSSLSITVTLTSWRVGDRLPSEEVRPHPITVAVSSVNCERVEEGRQIGEAKVAKMRLDNRVKMEKS